MTWPQRLRESLGESGFLEAMWRKCIRFEGVFKLTNSVICFNLLVLLKKEK